MNKWHPETIVEILLECGRAAMDFYGKKERTIKADHSLVTAADKKIEAILSGYFNHPDDGVYMIGEETVEQRDEAYIRDALSGTCWIVDPIDGTAPFANNLPTWGISIAFAENGIVREGAIFQPATGEIMLTTNGKNLYAEDLRSGCNWDFSHLRELAPHPVKFDPGTMVAVSQKMTKYGTIDIHNPVHATGSCVYSVTGLILGRYSVYFATVKLWDIASGLPMLANAGLAAKTNLGMEITSEVSESLYHLAPGDPKRWFLRGVGIIAPDMETVDAMLNRIELPDY